jgi:hypothetical protein
MKQRNYYDKKNMIGLIILRQFYNLITQVIIA